jgi:hypothetical protein
MTSSINAACAARMLARSVRAGRSKRAVERVHVGIDGGREERVGLARRRQRRESGRDGADLDRRVLLLGRQEEPESRARRRSPPGSP